MPLILETIIFDCANSYVIKTIAKLRKETVTVFRSDLFSILLPLSICCAAI